MQLYGTYDPPLLYCYRGSCVELPQRIFLGQELLWTNNAARFAALAWVVFLVAVILVGFVPLFQNSVHESVDWESDLRSTLL
mmetsp:Transcript_87615/g.200159  ORF Transcript_87615/g.200159 Transcript_87615/m.200159 type:complete len:82 (-) Transcript_87615:82-327(-)